MAKMKTHKKFDINDRKMPTIGVIPKGEYLVEIIKSEWKTSESSKKDYLRLIWQILKGDYKGRKVYQDLYLFSDSVEFREGQEGILAEIHKMAGFKTLVSDTEKLHKKAMMAEIGIKSPTQDEIDNGFDREKNVFYSFDTPKANTSEKPWEEEEEKLKNKKKKGKKKKDK